MLTNIGLHPSKLLLGEHAVATYVACPPAGTPFEDLLRPEYWAHVAAKLQPQSLILVFPEDGLWEAELRVRDIGLKRVTVGVLRHTVWPDPAAADLGAESLFEIAWGGPAHQWRIIRKSDRAVVDKNLPTKEAAFARLPDLLKAA